MCMFIAYSCVCAFFCFISTLVSLSNPLTYFDFDSYPYAFLFIAIVVALFLFFLFYFHSMCRLICSLGTVVSQCRPFRLGSLLLFGFVCVCFFFIDSVINFLKAAKCNTRLRNITHIFVDT